MTRSKPIAYCEQKFRMYGKSELIQQLEDAPIRKNEVDFMKDIIDGMQYKELSAKYNKSISRLVQWKREICTKLLQYDMQKLC